MAVLKLITKFKTGYDIYKVVAYKSNNVISDEILVHQYIDFVHRMKDRDVLENNTDLLVAVTASENLVSTLDVQKDMVLTKGMKDLIKMSVFQILDEIANILIDECLDVEFEVDEEYLPEIERVVTLISTLYVEKRL